MLGHTLTETEKLLLTLAVTLLGSGVGTTILEAIRTEARAGIHG